MKKYIYQYILFHFQISNWKHDSQPSSESNYVWILSYPNWGTLFCTEFELLFQVTLETAASNLLISACLTGRQGFHPTCGSTTTSASISTTTTGESVTPSAAPSSIETSSKSTSVSTTATTTQAAEQSSVGTSSSTETSSVTTTTTTTETTAQSSARTSSARTEAPSTTTTQTTAEVTQVQTTTTLRPSNDSEIYREVLSKSILFYEAQRSGILPDDKIEWRGDSAVNDQGYFGEDLSGGWYDAGDHVKFNFPQAASVTVLAWGILTFWDSYEQAGELANALDSIKWPLDYFLKCHVAPNKFYAQVGDGHIDHAYWGSPEDMTMYRPAFQINETHPGSDLAGEVAAAMAASSMVFRRYGQVEYADILLGNATLLFNFADIYRGKYSDSIPQVVPFYNSFSGFEDELAWSALWLYNATGDDYYLDKTENYHPTASNWFGWDDKTAGVALMMITLDTSKKDQAKANFEQFLNNWANGGNGITITGKGLSWLTGWGSLRHASNAAFLALVAAKVGIRKDTGIDFARRQIHYALGDTGRSFVCGFGVNEPKKPHHRGSSCVRGRSCDINAPGDNPNVLCGALVGGPDADDYYADERTDYRRNEVATDYNAGFQSSIAGLIELTT